MSAPSIIHIRGCTSCMELPFVCPMCNRTCAPCFGAADTDPELCDDCADREARARDLCSLASFCNAAAARWAQLATLAISDANREAAERKAEDARRRGRVATRQAIYQRARGIGHGDSAACRHARQVTL